MYNKINSLQIITFVGLLVGEKKLSSGKKLFREKKSKQHTKRHRQQRKI